ncbi:MAG: hypothetical protein V2A77_10170 [Pseudomonadota bacterium]
MVTISSSRRAGAVYPARDAGRRPERSAEPSSEANDRDSRREQPEEAEIRKEAQPDEAGGERRGGGGINVVV